MPTAAETALSRGLEGVVANESAVCYVFGEEGRLIYRGYDIHDLADHSTFEETAYLLLKGDLPTREQLKEFAAQLKAAQKLDKVVQRVIKDAPLSASPMNVLRTAVSASVLGDPDRHDNSPAAEYRKAVRLIAQLPTMVAMFHRLRNGQKPLAPRRGLSLAANLLYMTSGTTPEPDVEHALDVALLLHADHELNASTFAARVIAATLADMHGAVTGAIAALAGPLHGGANTEVMKMLLDIKTPDRAEAWIHDALARKEKIMGFGHRVYRTEDPRAAHLRRMSEELGRKFGQSHWFAMQRTIEDVMKREKGLYCNVDFYSASTYYVMGIPLDLYTPIFAVSRVSGWCAHVLEQHGDNRLIRPRAEYVGAMDRKWIPARKRGGGGRRVSDAGQKIDYRDGRWHVPDRPIIPFIEGDGTGPDIWRAARRVFDAAVAKSSGGRRRVDWREAVAGEKSFKQSGNWLPDETLALIRAHRVAIKGPLTTPVGGGIRSLNVTLRQLLDLYACIRPVRWFRGVPSPMKEPDRLDVVIFRENIEDVYAGIEYAAGSDKASRVRDFLTKEMGATIREQSAIGIKPMSRFGSQRLVAKAIQYALAAGRPSVTLVHKGNIMKFTEGAFRDWGYEVAKERFGDRTMTETEAGNGKREAGKVVIKDRIADAMFQQLLLRPDEYSVIAAPNLNGDYLSDACAAQVGGLGMAPGANIGDGYAVFEATHGTAPKYAGQDKVNPGSVILSGALMFEELGWTDVATAIPRALEGAIGAGCVTYDLARQMPGATPVSTSAFGDAIIEHLP